MILRNYVKILDKEDEEFFINPETARMGSFQMYEPRLESIKENESVSRKISSAFKDVKRKLTGN